jgi:serine protease
MHVSVNRTPELSGSAPNDPLFPMQWGLPSLHLPDAWERTLGHGYVGVVDTGIDTTHPDLRAFDGAGNYLGGNFRQQLSRDYGYDDDNVDEGEPQVESGQLRQVDRAGHGTHVAGIVGATTNQPLGGELGGGHPGCCRSRRAGPQPQLRLPRRLR